MGKIFISLKENFVYTPSDVFKNEITFKVFQKRKTLTSTIFYFIFLIEIVSSELKHLSSLIKKPNEIILVMVIENIIKGLKLYYFCVCIVAMIKKKTHLLKFCVYNE